VTFRNASVTRRRSPPWRRSTPIGRDPQLLRAFILQREWRAGEPVYSDINFILLGFVLERLSGKTIRTMDPGPGFAFSAEPDRRSDGRLHLAPSRALGEVCTTTIARRCRARGMPVLFGTAASILDFAQALLDGTGASPASIALMRTRLSANRTHGWECPYEKLVRRPAVQLRHDRPYGFYRHGLWSTSTTARHGPC